MGSSRNELPFTQNICTEAFLRLKGEKVGPIVGVLTNKAVLEKLNVNNMSFIINFTSYPARKRRASCLIR